MAAWGLRMRCVRAVAEGVVAGLSVVCFVATGPGCASTGRATTSGAFERTPSNVTVFMPARTLERQRRDGLLFAHQSPIYARRDAMLGVR